MNNIEILYEDNDVIVCHKRAGVPVQSANISVSDLENTVKAYLARKGHEEKSTGLNENEEKPSVYKKKEERALWAAGNGRKNSELYVIHRLDQPVEGVVVFAKNKKAAAALSKQVQAGGGMNKTYLAVVYGRFDEDKKEGRLRDYITKDKVTKCARIVSPGESKGAEKSKDIKEAVLDYKVLSEKTVSSEGREEEISLVEIHLQTGRYHQIRAQFRNTGHPLLGDRRYGTDESNGLSAELGLKFVALCAKSLSFKHPASGKDVNFDVTPSEAVFNLENG